MPAFFIQLQNINYIYQKFLEFTSLFFFSIIAYMVLNIISSIFGVLLVAFAIAGELILTGNWKNFTYYYDISYFGSSVRNEPWFTPLPELRDAISFSICPIGVAEPQCAFFQDLFHLSTPET